MNVLKRRKIGRWSNIRRIRNMAVFRRKDHVQPPSPKTALTNFFTFILGTYLIYYWVLYKAFLKIMKIKKGKCIHV